MAALLTRTLATANEQRAYVVIMLLNVLACDFYATDAFGGAVLMWRADPWLAHCARHNVSKRRLVAVTAEQKLLVKSIEHCRTNIFRLCTKLRKELHDLRLPPSVLATLVHQ